MLSTGLLSYWKRKYEAVAECRVRRKEIRGTE